MLDMGQMVKIEDLARELIRLSGYEPDKDIKIVYTGMRPGEKLYEELFTNREEMAATRHERIFISRKELDNRHVDITKSMGLLIKSSLKDKSEVLKIIMELVPEYQGVRNAYMVPVNSDIKISVNQMEEMNNSHQAKQVLELVK